MGQFLKRTLMLMCHENGNHKLNHVHGFSRLKNHVLGQYLLILSNKPVSVNGRFESLLKSCKLHHTNPNQVVTFKNVTINVRKSRSTKQTLS